MYVKNYRFIEQIRYTRGTQLLIYSQWKPQIPYIMDHIGFFYSIESMLQILQYQFYNQKLQTIIRVRARVAVRCKKVLVVRCRTLFCSVWCEKYLFAHYYSKNILLRSEQKNGYKIKKRVLPNHDVFWIKVTGNSERILTFCFITIFSF